MQIYKLIFLIITPISVLGCSHNQTSLLSTYPMKCKTGEVCELIGDLTIYIQSSSSVGLLESRDQCMALALPGHVLKRDREWDGRKVLIKGVTYEQRGLDGAVISYVLNDRSIATGICETGTVVYVTEIEKK